MAGAVEAPFEPLGVWSWVGGHSEQGSGGSPLPLLSSATSALLGQPLRPLWTDFFCPMLLQVACGVDRRAASQGINIGAF